MSWKPTPLEEGYTAEFDTVDKNEWHNIIDQFSDSNIYQTWSYDAVRCGEGNISHCVLRLNNKIVAAAQARIVRIPIIGLGAAYIRWGPLWQLRNQNNDPGIFRMAIRALRNEYVRRRGLVLRIFPILFDEDSELYQESLSQEGYKPTPKESAQRTLVLDIQPSIEELRKNLKQKWRNCLNKSERNQLEIIEGTDDHLFEEFIGLYRELLERKKFEEPNDINEFRMIQKDLLQKNKMGIFLSKSNGFNSAGAICTAIGDTGVYLFGATNDEGVKNKGSYLLQWKAIQWMKNNGCRYYNLNGINPETNPGSYHFKSGVSGKRGMDVQYLGRFDCYSGMVSATLARIADSVLPLAKRIASTSGLIQKGKPNSDN
jgi:hypothetical protein